MFEGRNIYVVDAEVLHSPDDLSTGWNDKKALGLSLAGAYSYRTQSILWFDRTTLAATLQRWVDERPLLVGFNSYSFDFPLFRAILREEAEQLGVPELAQLCDQFKLLCAEGYDILHEVRQVAGRSFGRGLNSLDSLCLANSLGQKTGHGAEAPRLWQQGRYAEGMNYLQNDITLTRKLFELVLTNHGAIQRRDGPITLALPVLPAR